ncbi:MAG: fumarylacetoacetate hydrolase family protein, partial [Phycisphaerales bacterium JB060]
MSNPTDAYHNHPHYPIDETHDPKLQSWVESANDPGTDFPIQNLPLCTIHEEGEDGDIATAVGVVVGDMVLDLNHLSISDVVPEDDDDWAFFGLDVIARDRLWPKLRREVQRLLRADVSDLRDHADRDTMLRPLAQTRFGLWPFEPRDYTDFYASLYHATSVGSMFRPDNPILPNYKHVPIGYHGRASSIVPSGTGVRRPVGQQAPAEDGGSPSFGPCKLLDYELEVGVVVGRGNALGDTIPIGDAEAHMLGLCLVNDWSARDLQKWEYQPLG